MRSSFMADEIHTKRLMLHRAHLDDAAAMHAVMSDALAMRYWSSLPHATMGDTERWIESMVAAGGTASDDFIITLDGVLIGKLGAWRLPEVGFLIAREHWGKGYASEAFAAFIARRRDLGSTEITADVDPRNLASLNLLERHGFVETERAAGTWQIGEELCDSVYLRIAF